MQTLASAFTNEGYERGSHALLLRWLTARFPEHTAPPETLESLKHSHWVSRDKVRDAFLSVARVHYNAGIVDADVQSGLGVLFYTDGDFARARDCFAAALAVRPKDYLLWNRYGSALSNGDKPEEALGAYREALQLRPTYTRAIYNVGVACAYPTNSDMGRRLHAIYSIFRLEHWCEQRSGRALPERTVTTRHNCGR